MVRFYVLVIALFFTLFPVSGAMLFGRKGALFAGILGAALAFFSGSAALIVPNVIAVTVATLICYILPESAFEADRILRHAKGIIGRILASFVLGLVTYSAWIEGYGTGVSVLFGLAAVLLTAICLGILVRISRVTRRR